MKDVVVESKLVWMLFGGLSGGGLPVFCLLDFSAGCSPWLACIWEVLGIPVLVVSVSSAAAFNSDLGGKWFLKSQFKKMAPCLVQCVCTEVKRFFFSKEK